MTKKLTKNDYEILRVMSEKGVTNSKKISEELGISDKTVRNKMKTMKKLGVYKRGIVIEPKFFGYSLRVDFFLHVPKKNVDDVINWLVQSNNHSITYLGRHWGDDNISMQCVFKDGEASEEFERDLNDNPMIEDFELSIVPVIFKDTHNWRPHEEDFNITPKAKRELDERRRNSLNTTI